MILSGLLSLGYVGISSYIAEQLVYEAPKAIVKTPASLSLQFANVSFPSRDDRVSLKGWLIPGVLPDGRLTIDRVIVAVHGTRTNRESPGDHLLELTAALARHGLGVLSFDMRGMGESPPAPLSMGTLEQRDVLGAVDFLRSGALPFPELGRPRAVGGLGISMGAATLLLAAAREPAIKAVVSDSAYADVVPLLEREIAKRSVAPIGRVPGVLAPASLVMARLLYGVDFFAARPVATVAAITPRPLLLIHGTADDYVPIENFRQLHAAATSPSGSHVTTWIVPGARHAQAFKKTGAEYVTRVVAFFDTGLGADQSSAAA
jgi:dipeptidyl aminopeptidase/acylaminoacyl peptidase